MIYYQATDSMAPTFSLPWKELRLIQAQSRGGQQKRHSLSSPSQSRTSLEGSDTAFQWTLI